LSLIAYFLYRPDASRQNIKKTVHHVEETQQIPATQEIVMGSPPSSLSGSTLPASDINSTASAISTQQVDTQYLQDLLGMRHGVSAAPDSEMLGMTSVWRFVLHNVIGCLQIWRRRSQKRLDHPATQVSLVRRCLLLTTIPGALSG